MNKQQKPLTAEEMYNETSLFGTRDETIELMERFAAQQVAAALADKKEPEPTDINNLYYQWYKNSECVGPSLLDAFKAGHEQQTAALREELEVIKARNEGLEQEKQEYIDKYNLAISELEAVKKELRSAVEVIEYSEKSDKAAREGWTRVSLQLSEVTRQRDEGAALLRGCLQMAENLGQDWKAVRDFLSRLASGETKPKSPWISVEERLPEKNCTEGACVLGMSGKVPMIVTYTSGREIDVMDELDELDETQVDSDEKTGMLWLKPGWYELEEQLYGAHDNAWIERKVTHWMPLPAPPQSLT